VADHSVDLLELEICLAMSNRHASWRVVMSYGANGGVLLDELAGLLRHLVGDWRRSARPRSARLARSGVERQ
jgi:hypothetical protein